MTKKKIDVEINEKGFYLIKKPGEWIKLKPQSSPSGLMIIFPDKKQHHYDLYDENGRPVSNTPIKLVGYSDVGYLYARSGSNIYEINPKKEPKIIPDMPAKITYFHSGGKTIVKSTSPGWLYEIHKE